MSALSVAAAAEDAPEHPALVGDLADGRGAWTYRELAARVAARAQTLPTGPVLLAPATSSDDVVSVLAALEAGATLALAHPRWSDPEREAVRARIGHATGRVVLFTSGSSGRPKGVCLSEAALVAAARAHAAALPWEPDDRWLLSLSLAHAGGLAVLTRALLARKTVVVSSASRFDPGALLETIGRERVTLLSVVPTMLQRLAALRAPPSLRAVLVGGAACPPELLAAARGAGWPALTTYGLSECGGQACTQRLGTSELHGCGPALPGVAVRIGEDEQILLGGPTLMVGYLDAPTPISNGWLHTGDLGRLDADGRLHVLGRRDARIITGGENVDPSEVEAALRTHPAVEDACVLGLPDPTWGQRVAALVVASPQVGLAALRAHLAPRLAGFKHPRTIAFVDALPRLPNGKPDRVAVAEARDALTWSR